MSIKFKSKLSEIDVDGKIVQSKHRVIKHTDTVQDLVVTVITKTAAHPEFGNGSSSGFVIDGVEGAYLEFTPGITYKFDQSDSSNANHPLRFYEDSAKATAYTTGVTTSGTPGSAGAYTQIAPTTSTPAVLFYQCSAHSLMGSYVKFGTVTSTDTYSINVAQDGGNVDLNLDAASGTDSTVQLTAGSNITLTRNDANQVTIASTASGGVTVQEEGSSLSTEATTLNFVGDSVTASGTGATKTITITGGSGAGTVTIEKNTITATASQVNFTIDSEPASVNNLQVYLDGVYQAKSNYTFSGNTISINSPTGVDAGVKVEIIHLKVVDARVELNSYTGDGSDRTFSTQSNINNKNNVQVYIDGVYQSKDTYDASGTIVTFNTGNAPPNGTTVELLHIVSTSSENELANYNVSVISANTNAQKDYLYVLTATCTLTLPSAPSVGDSIKISNRSGVATATVARNGKKIMGAAEDLTLDKLNSGFEMIFSGDAQGWILIGVEGVEA
ncbi:MAG: hypothetical protein DWQ21_09335 [Bacteroidetes bacterium]|nr:MAG: hypothetical protein DWQ21_09335 [Bacteroidota bacterium]